MLLATENRLRLAVFRHSTSLLEMQVLEFNDLCLFPPWVSRAPFVLYQWNPSFQTSQGSYACPCNPQISWAPLSLLPCPFSFPGILKQVPYLGRNTLRKGDRHHKGRRRHPRNVLQGDQCAVSSRPGLSLPFFVFEQQVILVLTVLHSLVNTYWLCFYQSLVTIDLITDRSIPGLALYIFQFKITSFSTLLAH